MSISKAAAVLLTIAYADQFNFPLNEAEIYHRLVKISLSKNNLKKILASLEKMGLIEYGDQLWKLSVGKAQAKVRLERERYSQKKWLEVNKLLNTISWIPWIRGVAVTGSLAVNNVSSDGDIDLMIVVAPRRLWLVRILVSISALWAGKRRTWQGSEENSWCFNLWLDEDSLSLPHRKRNIYSAYEVCQARWVLDRGEIEKRFFQDNSWVKKLLPNFYKNSTGLSAAAESSWWLSLLNSIVFKVQYLYMYSHMSREGVSLSSAYFHPRSTKGHIYSGWLRSLEQLGKTKKRIVLVTGVFDLFHQEHQNFLRASRAAGDLLIVGVESDARVRKNKGLSRPTDDQQKRVQQLQLFSVVDLAFVLPEKFDAAADQLRLLKLIKPDILAASSHTPYLKEKQQLMKKVGGEVRVVYELQSNTSTTQILAKE
jgi:D-glycero-beta-D-manno-heptose 1-phosphate adenylyltransferase